MLRTICGDLLDMYSPSFRLKRYRRGVDPRSRLWLKIGQWLSLGAVGNVGDVLFIPYSLFPFNSVQANEKLTGSCRSMRLGRCIQKGPRLAKIGLQLACATTF